MRVNHNSALSRHAISCKFLLWEKNANIHHYEMYIIGHGFKLEEGEIITYKTIFTSGIQKK